MVTIDGGAEIIPGERIFDINGLAIDPAARVPIDSFRLVYPQSTDSTPN